MLHGGWWDLSQQCPEPCQGPGRAGLCAELTGSFHVMTDILNTLPHIWLQLVPVISLSLLSAHCCSMTVPEEDRAGTHRPPSGTSTHARARHTNDLSVHLLT